MRYALVAGQRVEARTNLEGVCPNCKEPVVAKCGDRRVWHWAHRGKRTCDVWWEPETDWHRGWKDHFPCTCQEVIHHAPDSEKHIADVKTPHGLCIEFQHSFLNQQERRSREAFYRNMVWVVDGTRRKGDRKRFIGAIAKWRRLSTDVFITPWVEEGLPVEWLNSSVPVYFDFGNRNEPDDPFPIVSPVVWCLLPQKAMGNAVIVAVNTVVFIRACQEGNAAFDGSKLVDAITIHIRREQQLAYAAYLAQRARSKLYYRRRSRRRLPRF